MAGLLYILVLLCLDLGSFYSCPTAHTSGSIPAVRSGLVSPKSGKSYLKNTPISAT